MERLTIKLFKYSNVRLKKFLSSLKFTECMQSTFSNFYSLMSNSLFLFNRNEMCTVMMMPFSCSIFFFMFQHLLSFEKNGDTARLFFIYFCDGEDDSAVQDMSKVGSSFKQSQTTKRLGSI